MDAPCDLPTVAETETPVAVLEAKPAPSHTCRTLTDDTRLNFRVVSTDGGEFSKEYGCTNALRDDEHCYCSSSRQNVNLVCQYNGRSPFTMTSIEVKAPVVGFTAPLGQGLVFCTWEKPTEAFIRATRRWDNVSTHAEYSRLKALQAREGSPADGADPVAFFDLTHGYRATVTLDVPRSGRYVVVKLVRSKCCNSPNIDVQYLGFRGWTRPQAFASASYC